MPTAAMSDSHTQLRLLSKSELHELADGLLDPEPWAVERCVAFVVAETQGLWHGRARAWMCRRLKHCALGRTHRAALLACICGGLSDGSFSEQFKDQLRVAMHLDPPRTLEAARMCLASPRPHVRRYAQWALSLEPLHRVS
jgi:hypothetical protein